MKFKLRSQFVCLCWPWRAVGMHADERESHAPIINFLGIPKVIQSLWVLIGPVAQVWTPLTTTPCKPLTPGLWFPVFPCKSMKYVCFVSSHLKMPCKQWSFHPALNKTTTANEKQDHKLVHCTSHPPSLQEKQNFIGHQGESIPTD